MSEIKRVQDQLRRTFEGPAWHGPSVKQVLSNVTVPVALARPIPAAHNIWELALHILAWQKHVFDRIQRSTSSLTAEQDWPAVPTNPTEMDWNQLLQSLDQSHQTLLNEISGWSDEELESNVPGKEYSKYLVLHGLIHHNLFHAGQISILKK